MLFRSHDKWEKIGGTPAWLVFAYVERGSLDWKPTGFSNGKTLPILYISGNDIAKHDAGDECIYFSDASVACNYGRLVFEFVKEYQDEGVKCIEVRVGQNEDARLQEVGAVRLQVIE